MSDIATLAGRVEKLRANLAAGRQAQAACANAQSSSLASLAEAMISPAEAPPAPTRVLVMEADPLLRQVLARMVENLGYAVDSPDAAEEAVAAFEGRHYALVMLDCDSSATWGLETAALLRGAESGPERTPIIALTARTRKDDHERRQAAGIDDYLAKPILRKNVRSVLSRYGRAGPAQEPGTAWRYLALDQHTLEELEEAALGRVEILSGWINMFFSGVPDLLTRMRVAQEEGDAAALSDAANQLRSRSGQMGALRAQEICGVVGALAASGSLAGVESLIAELAIALQRAAGELHQFEDDIRRGRRLAGARPSNRVLHGSNQVLLAGTDPLIARFLANSLADGGIVVTQVSRGEQALEAILETEFGAVILCPDTGESDRYHLLSEIRMRPDPTPRVVVVSSRRQEHDILRAFELGADDYVTIPFSPFEVVARVRSLVKRGAYAA